MRTSIWLVLAFLLVSGCESFFMRRFNPPKDGADIRTKTVFVVPFREQGWYGESSFGNSFATALSSALDKECDLTTFLDETSAKKLRTKILEWYEEGEPPWSLFAEQSGVDMLIMGKIRRLSFTSQNLVGMLHGRLQVDLKIWTVSEDKHTWESVLTYSFPEDPEHGKILPSFEQNEQEIRQQLVAMAGEDIVKICCGKTEDLRSKD